MPMRKKKEREKIKREERGNNHYEGNIVRTKEKNTLEELRNYVRCL